MKSAYNGNFLACALVCVPAFTSTRAADVTPADCRAIAKEACIYGFTRVGSYRITHACFVDRAHPEYEPEVESFRSENP